MAVFDGFERGYLEFYNMRHRSGDVAIINEAVGRVGIEARGMIQNDSGWRGMPEDELWYELVACILGSRVPFHMSVAAAQRLRSVGLLDTGQALPTRGFEERIAKALSTPFFDGKFRGQRYRFPRSRANWLRRSVEQIYANGGSLSEKLGCCGDGGDARAMLLEKVVGVGPKQASLFLRNVGYSLDLAILDVHVLDYLKLNDLMNRRSGFPRTLRDYEKLEAVFREHASLLMLPVACLDIAVWIVMRVSGMRIS